MQEKRDYLSPGTYQTASGNSLVPHFEFLHLEQRNLADFTRNSSMQVMRDYISPVIYF